MPPERARVQMTCGWTGFTQTPIHWKPDCWRTFGSESSSCCDNYVKIMINLEPWHTSMRPVVLRISKILLAYFYNEASVKIHSNSSSSHQSLDTVTISVRPRCVKLVKDVGREPLRSKDGNILRSANTDKAWILLTPIRVPESGVNVKSAANASRKLTYLKHCTMNTQSTGMRSVCLSCGNPPLTACVLISRPL